MSSPKRAGYYNSQLLGNIGNMREFKTNLAIHAKARVDIFWKDKDSLPLGL
jgi:hypothetical protein